VKTETALSQKKVAAQTIDELVSRYEFSNVAEGKSPKTTAWYRDMLTLFSGFLKNKQYPSDPSGFNIDTVRGYILYLRQKPKFEGHPYTPAQAKSISPKTVQCHVRALKAFSSWLYAEGYTLDNRLKNLKIPKAPVTVIEPLTAEEI